MLPDGSVVEALVSGFPKYFYIKGYVHPLKGYIVQYYREVSGRKATSSLTSTFLPCLGKRVEFLYKQLIVNYIYPDSAFGARRDELPKPILKLIEELNVDYTGLTGSWAIGFETSRSDVDLIIYSSDSDWLKTLKMLKKKGIISQCAAERIIRKRIAKRDIGVNTYHIERVLTEQCIMGVPYSLRAVRRLAPVECIEYQQAYVKLGVLKAVLHIQHSNELDAYLVPATYPANIVKVLKADDIVKRVIQLFPPTIHLESWRIRYQGLEPGEYAVSGEVFYDLAQDKLIVTPDFEGAIISV